MTMTYGKVALAPVVDSRRSTLAFEGPVHEVSGSSVARVASSFKTHTSAGFQRLLWPGRVFRILNWDSVTGEGWTPSPPLTVLDVSGSWDRIEIVFHPPVMMMPHRVIQIAVSVPENTNGIRASELNGIWEGMMSLPMLNLDALAVGGAAATTTSTAVTTSTASTAAITNTAVAAEEGGAADETRIEDYNFFAIGMDRFLYGAARLNGPWQLLDKSMPMLDVTVMTSSRYTSETESPRLMVVGANGRLYIKDDLNAQWKPALPATDTMLISSITIMEDGTILAVGMKDKQRWTRADLAPQTSWLNQAFDQNLESLLTIDEAPYEEGTRHIAVGASDKRFYFSDGVGRNFGLVGFPNDINESLLDVTARRDNGTFIGIDSKGTLITRSDFKPETPWVVGSPGESADGGSGQLCCFSRITCTI